MPIIVVALPLCSRVVRSLQWVTVSPAAKRSRHRATPGCGGGRRASSRDDRTRQPRTDRRSVQVSGRRLPGRRVAARTQDGAAARSRSVTSAHAGRVRSTTGASSAVRPDRRAQHGAVPPRSPYDNLVHPRTSKKPVPQVEAEKDLVVEDPSSGFVGAVVRCEKDVVHLEDRFGRVTRLPARARASGSTAGRSCWSGPKHARAVRPAAQRVGLDCTSPAPAPGSPARAGSTSRASTTPSWWRRSGATTCASRASSSSRCTASTTCPAS